MALLKKEKKNIKQWFTEDGATSKHHPGPQIWAMFTLGQIGIAPAQKPYQIGPLFTYKNSDFVMKDIVHCR